MVNSVRLLTLKEILKLESYILCREMATSICFTSRLNGVHLTKNTTKLNVTMHIIGKILGENLTFLTMMLMIFAKIGRRERSLVSMKKVVFFSRHASGLMDGKNKSFTHLTIKLSLVKT